MDRKIGDLTLRELIGFALLVALLFLGLLSSWYMGRQQEQAAGMLEESAWLALSGQWENARQLARSGRNRWECGWKIWAVLGDHGPMEEIDGLLAEMTVYSAAGERTDFARVCALLAEKMEAMANAHRFRWWNVL